MFGITSGVSGNLAEIMERLRFDYLGKIVQRDRSAIYHILPEAPKMPEAQWLAAENHLIFTTHVFVKIQDLALICLLPKYCRRWYRLD
jgi:hypothetical protein